ncbi:MAG: hypothetical protein OSA38_04170 [Candidatus Poseidoniaceae archaeon]|nr:hypothetical protein [Candidatus Poseidoniaceae archaeon]
MDGTVNLTIDDWGVKVEFDNEYRKPIYVSGPWDILVVHSDSISARSCGWSLSVECPYPEVGVNIHFS